MSWYVSIFCATEDPNLDAFCRFFAGVTGLDLHKDGDLTYPLFLHLDDTAYVVISTHGVQSADELEYERYPYWVRMRAVRKDWESYEQAQQALLRYTRAVFDALAQSNRCSLLMIDDDEHVYAVYPPNPAIRIG